MPSDQKSEPPATWEYCFPAPLRAGTLTCGPHPGTLGEAGVAAPFGGWGKDGLEGAGSGENVRSNTIQHHHLARKWHFEMCKTSLVGSSLVCGATMVYRVLRPSSYQQERQQRLLHGFSPKLLSFGSAKRLQTKFRRCQLPMPWAYVFVIMLFIQSLGSTCFCSLNSRNLRMYP